MSQSCFWHSIDVARIGGPILIFYSKQWALSISVSENTFNCYKLCASSVSLHKAANYLVLFTDLYYLVNICGTLKWIIIKIFTLLHSMHYQQVRENKKDCSSSSTSNWKHESLLLLAGYLFYSSFSNLSFGHNPSLNSDLEWTPSKEMFWYCIRWSQMKTYVSLLE